MGVVAVSVSVPNPVFMGVEGAERIRTAGTCLGTEYTQTLRTADGVAPSHTASASDIGGHATASPLKGVLGMDLGEEEREIEAPAPVEAPVEKPAEKPEKVPA